MPQVAAPLHGVNKESGYLGHMRVRDLRGGTRRSQAVCGRLVAFPGRAFLAVVALRLQRIILPDYRAVRARDQAS